MVGSLPRMTIRDVLLVIVTSTWAVVTVISAWRDNPLDLPYWLIPAAAIGAIIKIFSGRRPPDDRGEE